MKEYTKPEVELVEFSSDEIMDSIIGGEIGTTSNVNPDWE